VLVALTLRPIRALPPLVRGCTCARSTLAGGVLDRFAGT